MAPLRMDHVTLVVEDLEGAIGFFLALGMEVEGRTSVEGEAVDRICGLEGVRADIAMVQTADGRSKLELTRYVTPTATTAEPSAPPNTLGYRQVMFQVDDLRATVARLQPHGGELIGEVVPFGDTYVLAYVRGPAGTIVALAEQTAEGPTSSAS